MKVMIGARSLEFFLLLDDRRRRRDDDLLDLVNAAAFFAPLHFENKAVLLANLRRDVRLDRLVLVREDVEVVHQLLDELEIFQPELRRQILDDDRRLDVNDLRPSSVSVATSAVSSTVGSGGRRPAPASGELGRAIGVGLADAGNRRAGSMRLTDSSVGIALRLWRVRLDQRNAFPPSA